MKHWPTRAIYRRNTTSNQPAELAERVIAPGEAEAEPGVTAKTRLSLRSWRPMGLVAYICKVITIEL